MENQPPQLQKDQNGEIIIESLAQIVEWFLTFDERVAALRFPQVDQIYQWRQQDANANGDEMQPFPRAEDRFAVGIFAALAENSDETSLRQFMADTLESLQDAKQLAAEIAEANKFALKENVSPLDEANLLETNDEKRLYLSARWLEILCTAELRVLGWVYQDLYGKPFS